MGLTILYEIFLCIPTICSRTNRVRECKTNLKSTWVPTWHRMNRVSWTPPKNHLLEVVLTQKWEIMALRTLTNIGLFYLSCVRTHTKRKFIEEAFGRGPGPIWLHTTLEGMWPHCMILEVSLAGFGHFLLGSHNVMVATLGSCVKWPKSLDLVENFDQSFENVETF